MLMAYIVNIIIIKIFYTFSLFGKKSSKKITSNKVTQFDKSFLKFILQLFCLMNLLVVYSKIISFYWNKHKIIESLNQNSKLYV